MDRQSLLDLGAVEVLKSWDKNNPAPKRRLRLEKAPKVRANVPLERGLSFSEGGKRIAKSLRGFMSELEGLGERRAPKATWSEDPDTALGEKAGHLLRPYLENLFDKGDQNTNLPEARWVDRENPEYQASIFAPVGGPLVGEVGPASQESLARALQKNYFRHFAERGGGLLAKEARPLIQEEMLARGPRPKFPKVLRNVDNVEIFGEKAKSELLRAPWFHGRRTHPWKGRPEAQARSLRSSGGGFESSRFKAGNLGEPLGISLTADPRTALGFGGTSRKTQKVLDWMEVMEARAVDDSYLAGKLDFETSRKKLAGVRDYYNRLSDLYNNRVARVLPRYGAPPEEVILDATNMEIASNALEGAYKTAVKRHLERSSEGFNRIAKSVLEHDETALYRDWLKPSTAELSKLNAFNADITESLQDQGFKGILYSPHRFEEKELRLFEPRRAFQLDLMQVNDARNAISPKRLERILDWQRATEPFEGEQSLRHYYKDVNLGTLVKQVLGSK